MSNQNLAVHYLIFRNCLQPPLLQALSSGLRLLAVSQPTVETNNRSGRSYFENKWLSAKDLHRSQDPAIRTLLSKTLLLATTYAHLLSSKRLPLVYHSCWGMISEHGLTGAPHSHSGLISGVTYLKAGDSGHPRAGGRLIMHTPGSTEQEAIVPHSGDLILFPSTQVHSVERYNSNKTRMVISFNLQVATNQSLLK